MGVGRVSTEYHPQWLRRPISTYWWLEKGAYFAFILRESSCLFVGWGVVYLLSLVNASSGPVGYSRFLEWSATPWVLALNVVSFAFIVYHAITFFAAAPQALVVHVGHKRVPARLVMIGHYAAWGAASAFVAWLVLRA